MSLKPDISISYRTSIVKREVKSNEDSKTPTVKFTGCEDQCTENNFSTSKNIKQDERIAISKSVARMSKASYKVQPEIHSIPFQDITNIPTIQKEKEKEKEKENDSNLNYNSHPYPYSNSLHHQHPLPSKHIRLLGIKKSSAQTTRVLTKLLNTPHIAKSSIISQIKCFMSNSFTHDSYLISRQLANQMKQKIKQIQKNYQYSFKYDQLAKLISKIQEKSSDSREVVASFQEFYFTYQYPISVKLMAIYFGVHLYSINAQYREAELMCKRLLDQLLKYKLDEYILIYLILIIKMKTNQSLWEAAIGFLSKTLTASWLYKLEDLQIWCYFQLSRCHFFLAHQQASQFFKQRSQMSIRESTNTIYRTMRESEFVQEIQYMRAHHCYFDCSNPISFQQLTQNTKRQKSTQPLKIQVHIKRITQNFKINHVKNLINRIGEKIEKIPPQTFARKYHKHNDTYAGNPLFRTHQSGIKNLNIYFRVPRNKPQVTPQNFYTFQNSHKNILVLKEMARHMINQMKWFVTLGAE